MVVRSGDVQSFSHLVISHHVIDNNMALKINSEQFICVETSSTNLPKKMVSFALVSCM